MSNLDLIVFPELFVTGYNLRDGHNQVAEKIPGNGLAQTKIHDLAKKYNIHIITGIVEKSGKSLFNSVTVYIGSNPDLQQSLRAGY